MNKNVRIELRERTLKSGNRSLYLEFYEKGGKRKYESLNLFLIPERTPNDRLVNESTLKQALKLKSERILGIERKEEVIEEKKVPKRIFVEWMDYYLEMLALDSHLSKAYCTHNRSTVNIIKAYLKHIRHPRMLMAKIDRAFYKSFIYYISHTYKNTKSSTPQPLSQATQMLIQTNLNRMLNYAVCQGVISKNPFYELDKRYTIKKATSTRTYLTVDELQLLSSAPTGSEVTRQTFLFCCYTGLRHSDIKTLQWKHIQKTDDGMVINKPSMVKTGQPIIIPLGKQAMSWMPDRGDANPADYVFVTPSISGANRALKHMAKSVGITKTITFHTSRHTFATMTLTAGSDIYTTSKLLGHTNIHTTEIYADVVLEKKLSAVNLLDGIF